MKKSLYVLAIFTAIFSFVVTATSPVYAAASTRETGQACAGQDGVLGIRTWYYNICDSQGNVDVGTNPAEFASQLGINLLSIALMVGGYISVGFVIWGGIKYMLAAGDSGKISSAKTTIQNALIGLLITLSAVAIVTLLQTNI